MKKPKAKKGVSERGGAGKGGVEEQKERLTEVDKEWFQIQIRSLEEKLQRRNDKMRVLEQSNKDYQERFEQLREDKADVVNYLKRSLQQRTDAVAELQARLEGLQQAHAADKNRYEGKLTAAEQDFARSKEQLVSENMVLAKKLDALEEFRIQREQLMSKYDEQEKKVDKLKQDYEARIYDQDKKHILEEDRLKKDMLAKLDSVAAGFRDASYAQMSATTQRTIRENVSLSAQVTQLSARVAELADENDVTVAQNKQLRRKIALLEAEQAKQVTRNAYRLKVIEDVSSRCRTQESRLSQLDSLHQERKEFESRIARLDAQIDQMRTEIASSANVSKERDSEIADFRRRLSGVAKTKDAIRTCLSEASGSIRAALSLQQTAIFEAEAASIFSSQREDVLNQLLTLLNTAMTEKKEKGPEVGRLLSARSVAIDMEVPADVDRGEEEERVDYLHGTLGLVPQD